MSQELNPEDFPREDEGVTEAEVPSEDEYSAEPPKFDDME